MSVNRYGEIELCQVLHNSKTFCISRDRAGNHVLRLDGKELFSKIRDDGRKNTKTGRVVDVGLLYNRIKEER